MPGNLSDLPAPQTDEEWRERRDEAVERLTSSLARRKLVVAGPGTGKTHAFGQLFRKNPGKHLTLTFIRRLVGDLEERLAGLSEVYTLHGFAKRMLYELPVGGISKSPTYYPPLPWIFASDCTHLHTDASVGDIYKSFHELDDSQGLIGASLRSGHYYDAVGHDDVVFRVLTHFRARPSDVPSYKHLVVDEYQDFNQLEVSFIEELARDNSLLVVGDDDQALYGFKHASPRFIRNLANDRSYERFHLPFCTRSTTVIVQAARRMVELAQGAGLLTERIDKHYVCYLPERRDDSESYPELEHALCSVERNDRSYMSRYIIQELDQLDPAEIRQSDIEHEPCALVVGPRQFIRRIYEELLARFPGTELSLSEGEEPSLLDGYKLLARDPRSRLGWRIVTYIEPLGNIDEILRKAISQEMELVDLLPGDYTTNHLETIVALRRYLDSESLSAEDQERLLKLGVVNREEAEASVEEEPRIRTATDGEGSVLLPRVVVTTMVGSKGLQANHVFIVGLINEHFPRDNNHPTENEVCQMLVALTRARKRCHLLSCQMFAGKWREPSIFLTWLAGLINTTYVDKAYLEN